MSAMSEETVITITDEALERIVEIRDQESAEDVFGLLIEITGLEGVQFGYSLSFVPVSEKRDTDHSELHGDLSVMIPEKDIDNLRGASLAISSQLSIVASVLDWREPPAFKTAS